MGLQYIVGKALKQTDVDLGGKLKSTPLEPLAYSKQDADLVARLRELAVADPVSSAALRSSLTAMVADFLERAGAQRITIELAVMWARLPVDAHPHWCKRRLGFVRGWRF